MISARLFAESRADKNPGVGLWSLTLLEERLETGWCFSKENRLTKSELVSGPIFDETVLGN